MVKKAEAPRCIVIMSSEKKMQLFNYKGHAYSDQENWYKYEYALTKYYPDH